MLTKLCSIYGSGRPLWCENCADDDNGKGYLESELQEAFGMQVCKNCYDYFSHKNDPIDNRAWSRGDD